MQKLLEQNFTMRIMYELFQYILETGPFNQVFPTFIFIILFYFVSLVYMLYDKI